MFAKPVRRAALVASCVIGAALVVTGPSASAAPHENHVCGDFVQHSFVLTNNLINCSGSGLILSALTAKGMTVDLNGMLLDGDGGAGDIGVSMVTRNIRVINGTIHQFGRGVQAISRGASIERVTAIANTVYGFSVSAAGVLSSDVAIGNTLDGFVMDAHGASITKSVATSNGAVGIDITGSTNVTIAGNISSDNGAQGIFINGYGDLIKGNAVSDNVGNGIEIHQPAADPNGHTVIRNRSIANQATGLLIAAGARNTLVSKNRVWANGYVAATPDGSGRGIDDQGVNTTGSSNSVFDNDNPEQCNTPSLC